METLHRTLLLLLLALATTAACERVEVDPAVADGPLPSPGDPIDPVLADAGALVYQKRCVACHRLQGAPLVGPNLGDVTERREYEWIRGMVLAPDSMLRVDSVARTLLEEYKVPMNDVGLDEPRFRAVLEFLRRSAREGVGSTDATPDATGD